MVLVINLTSFTAGNLLSLGSEQLHTTIATHSKAPAPHRGATPSVPGCGGTCLRGKSSLHRAPEDAAGCPRTISGHRGVHKYQLPLLKLKGAP